MDFNPLAFTELMIVLAFGVGWFILEKVANSYDRGKPEPRTDDPAHPTGSGEPGKDA
jgi:hypothetical protein